MLQINIFSIILLLLPLLYVNGSPYYCTEITTQYSQTVSDDSSFKQKQTGKFAEIVSDSNFTYSAKYSLYEDSKNYYIKLHNVTGFDTTFQNPISNLCYWFLDCTTDFTTSAKFDIKLLKSDPFIRFDINFGTNETFFIDGLFYDNGTLTHWDGTIFSPDKACVYDVFTDTGFVRNRTQCCTQFAPRKTAPINYPKCKKFRSRTTVRNLDFSIFGTSQVNYTLDGRKVAMSGNWAGKDTFGFEFANKFFENSNPSKVFSINFTLPNGDSKPFFTSIFVVDNLPIAVEDVIAFIVDGNNTLMTEGTPYTKQNDCSYHSFAALRGGVPLPTTVEMCCREFESYRVAKKKVQFNF